MIHPDLAVFYILRYLFVNPQSVRKRSPEIEHNALMFNRTMLGHYEKNLHKLLNLDPTVFGFNYVFDVMFMVILGGTGTLPGPVVGAFIVVFIPEILRMAAEWRMFYFALFMLAMIIFMPMGLWGFVKMQQMRYQEWKAMRLAEGLSAGLPSYLMYLGKEYWGKVTDFTSLMRAKFRRGADQEV